MLRLVWFLLTGEWHSHKWKIIKVANCESFRGEKWTRYYCQCEECGRIKAFDSW